MNLAFAYAHEIGSDIRGDLNRDVLIWWAMSAGSRPLMTRNQTTDIPLNL